MSATAPTAHSDLPTILVVDDEPSLRQVVQWLLEDEGYAISVADDGRAALRLLQRTQPALLLLDLRMPVVGGWEVLATLERERRTVPVIVMTAEPIAEADRRRYPVAGWLTKPLDLDVVATLVREVLQQRPAVSLAAAGV